MGGGVEGGKGRAPKLLLNQGPSEPCYATAQQPGQVNHNAVESKTNRSSCKHCLTRLRLSDVFYLRRKKERNIHAILLDDSNHRRLTGQWNDASMSGQVGPLVGPIEVAY